jgi:hypothetical protein
MKVMTKLRWRKMVEKEVARTYGKGRWGGYETSNIESWQRETVCERAREREGG